MFDEDRAQRLGVDLGNVKRAHFTVAFDQRDNGGLLRNGFAPVNVLGLAANICFVGFYNHISPADGAGVGVDRAFAKTVKEEPRCFVGDVEHSLKLLGNLFLEAELRTLIKLSAFLRIFTTSP